MNRENAVQKNLEGLELFREGKHEEALRKFNEAIEIDEKYPAPWFNRLAVNSKLGRETEAAADRERWQSLKEAVPTEESTLRRKAKAVVDMEKAERNIKIAVIAGAISGAVTLIFALTGALGFTKWSLIDAFIAFGLTFGIYKKSRVCAVALFAYWLGGKILTMVIQPDLIVPSLVGAILFGIFFFRGIQGTFAYHRIIKAQPKREFA